MIEVIIFCGLLHFASAERTGIELGDLFSGPSTNNHGVSGIVSVVNEATFFIANFNYDGKAPDAHFWVGKTPLPSPNGTIVPDELGTDLPLKRYQNRNVIISLPGELKILDIKWLSIWCRNFTADFGHVMIPDGFVAPEHKVLRPLLGRAHQVKSGSVVLIDSKTIQINGLYYDGNGPDAFFLVGKEGRPNGNGIKVPDENGRLSRLRGYQGQAITLRLPDSYTWFDLKWFAMYCIMANQNFGEVYIPRQLNIPIDLADLPPSEVPPSLTNCREIFPDKFLVRWKIQDVSLYIQLEGRAEEKEYLAFGISGSDDGAQMVGADVVVTYYYESVVSAKDYYINAKTQCAGAKGTCPDVNQGGRQNVGIVDWKYQDGILSVTYKRPLEKTEEFDKSINTDGSTTVVAAVGLINTYMEAAKHSKVTTELIKIDFNEDAQRCDSLKVITEPKPKLKPWPPSKISDESVFTARIGPSGQERGYSAITGIVGWGIAWWINGLLIPEITVKRGNNYTFFVEGGTNPLYSAEYHPFYITNNKQGGGAHEKVGTPEHMVYAGLEVNETGQFVPVGVGRYCEYKINGTDQSLESETFEDFKNKLSLECADGTPGEFKWMPDSKTPDLVYYQCYTHRNLGWKIHVTGTSTSQAVVCGGLILVISLCNAMLFYETNYLT